jgi:hypothetical protein
MAGQYWARSAKAVDSAERDRRTPGALALCSVLVLALASTACVTSRVEQYKTATTGLADGERIVILARQHHTTHEAEEGFTECVSSSLQRRNGAMTVASAEEFVDNLYPWFEPSTAPLAANELPELLARPGVAERLDESGVRYVIWLDGETERVDGGGGLSCAIGPGGGGCFGLAWWQTDADYEATVWDLHNRSNAGVVTTDVTGRSVIPAIVVPLPFIARTQSNACRGLAQQLSEFLFVEDGLSQ